MAQKAELAVHHKNLVQRLRWFTKTQDTAVFWHGCEGHFPIDDMKLAADTPEKVWAARQELRFPPLAVAGEKESRSTEIKD